MLRIYICPKCYNFRMVSRKPDAICFHCGGTLDKSDIEYSTYMNMTEDARNDYRENYKKRMKLYQNKMSAMLQENRIVNKKEPII